jgi:hypothetical protein
MNDALPDEQRVSIDRETLHEFQAALRFLSFARTQQEEGATTSGAAMVLAVTWLTQIGKRMALNG